MRLPLALIISSLMPAAMAAQLAAGPMAGPPDLRGVTLWLQLDGPATAAIEYWPADKPGAKRRTERQALLAAKQFAGHFTLSNLKPGQRYHYRPVWAGQGRQQAPTYSFTTQKLWQWRQDAPDFTVLAGSCNFGNQSEYDRPGKPYGDAHERIFKSMAQQQPALTLWLGDNIYYREVDYASPAGMAYRWQYDRSQDYLQPLLQTGGHAAIWDDHDYGPNDSNRSFVFKGQALALQQRYWANPGHGLPELPGAFTSFSFNDADFFLLDNRYYRDDHRLPDPERAMYGKAQMNWLENALLASTAPFKIIAGGSQSLHKGARGDSWLDYPAEQEDFLAFLNTAKVNGVLFLSGDVHRSELTKLERPGSYPLYDLTCSPLTSGAYVDDKLRQRPKLVDGTVVMGERNFCRLRFAGSKAARKLSIAVLNDQGELKWERELRVQELTTPKPEPVAP